VFRRQVLSGRSAKKKIGKFARELGEGAAMSMLDRVGDEIELVKVTREGLSPDVITAPRKNAEHGVKVQRFLFALQNGSPMHPIGIPQDFLHCAFQQVEKRRERKLSYLTLQEL
jgi:hypothetical protein